MKDPVKRPGHRWNVILVLAGIGLFPVLYLLTVFGVICSMISTPDAGGLESLGIVALIFGPSTLIVSVVMGLICLRKKRWDADMMDVIVTHGAVGGIANVLVMVLALILLVFADSSWQVFDGIGGVLAFGFAAAFFIGAPSGIVFAILLQEPLSFVAIQPGSHDSFLETMQITGRCMVRQGGIAALLLAVLLLATSGWHKTGIVVVMVLWLVVAGVGLVFLVSSRSRLHAQSDWVSKVAREEIADWQLVSTDRFTSEALEGLRPLALNGHGSTFVLIRRSPGTPTGGAYRTGEQVCPEALVYVDSEPVTSEEQ